MKKSMIKYILTLLMLAGMSMSYAQESKKTAILGFKNLGGAADANAAELMSRSLYNFLNVIPGTELHDLEDSLKTAAKQDAYNPEAAVTLGQKLGADLVLYGSYTVQDEEISIDVFAYDIITGELKFQKNYQGDAGLDIFDTVDAMIKNIAGLVLGKKISFAKINISIVPQKVEYRVYINGKFLSKVSSEKSFSQEILAGEENELSIKNGKTLKEVYRDLLVLKTDEEKNIQYVPMGSINVSVINLDKPADIYVNGEKKQSAQNNKIAQFKNLEADKDYLIEIKTKEGNVLGKMNSHLEEGGSSTLQIDVSSLKRQVFVLLRGMEGGPSASLGVEYRFSNMFRTAFYTGIQFVPYTSVISGYTNTTTQTFIKFGLEANMYFLDLMKGNFQVGGNVFLNAYMYSGGTASFALSPGVGLQSTLFKRIIVNAKVRYSLIDGSFYPMVGVGLTL